MRIFVTGATGFIGSAIVQDLLQAGHHVTGLARSDAAAASLTAAGAIPHRGALDDAASLTSAAIASDGVIHTAFIHDFSNIAASGVIDRQAIETLGQALAGTGKPLVVTSAIGLLTPGQINDETASPDPASHGKHRLASEQTALGLKAHNVRVSVVRLPPTVHGTGDRAFIPGLIRTARAKGQSAYIDDGGNRWPAVHRLDAARLFRLALNAPAGSVLHGVADTGIPTRDIAAAIARQLNLPLTAIPRPDAQAHFGWLAHFFALDCPATSQATQSLLNWQPSNPGLLADLAQPHYFAE